MSVKRTQKNVVPHFEWARYVTKLRREKIPPFFIFFENNKKLKIMKAKIKHIILKKSKLNLLSLVQRCFSCIMKSQ